MSAAYRQMSIFKKYLQTSSALAQIIHIMFKPSHSKLKIFHAKNGIWG